MSDQEDRAEADLSLAGLDAQADLWAAEINLTALVKNVAGITRLTRHAPDAVRERFIGRAEANFDAIARQAFIEGAMHAIDAICSAVESGTHPRFTMRKP